MHRKSIRGACGSVVCNVLFGATCIASFQGSWSARVAIQTAVEQITVEVDTEGFDAPEQIKCEANLSRPSAVVVELHHLKDLYKRRALLNSTPEQQFKEFQELLESLSASGVEVGKTEQNEYDLSMSMTTWEFDVRLKPSFDSGVMFQLIKGFTGKLRIELVPINGVQIMSVSDIDIGGAAFGEFSVKMIEGGNISGCSPQGYVAEVCKRVKTKPLMSMTKLAKLTSIVAFSVGANQINFGDEAAAPAWCDVASSPREVRLLPLRLLAGKESIYKSVARKGFVRQNVRIPEITQETLVSLLSDPDLKVAMKFVEDGKKLSHDSDMSAADFLERYGVQTCPELVEKYVDLASRIRDELNKHDPNYNRFGWTRNDDDIYTNFEILESLEFKDCSVDAYLPKHGECEKKSGQKSRFQKLYSSITCTMRRWYQSMIHQMWSPSDDD